MRKKCNKERESEDQLMRQRGRGLGISFWIRTGNACFYVSELAFWGV